MRRAWWCRRWGYLGEVAAACKDAGVLFVADEVQAGLGRTGSTLTCDWEASRPTW